MQGLDGFVVMIYKYIEILWMAQFVFTSKVQLTTSTPQPCLNYASPTGAPYDPKLNRFEQYPDIKYHVIYTYLVRLKFRSSAFLPQG